MKMSSFIPFSKIFLLSLHYIERCFVFQVHLLLSHSTQTKYSQTRLLFKTSKPYFPTCHQWCDFYSFSQQSFASSLYLSFIIARMSLSLSKCHTHTHTCTQISVCALFSSLSLLLTQTHPKYLCNSCFASCFLTRGQPIPQFQTKASAKTTKTILEFSV